MDIIFHSGLNLCGKESGMIGHSHDGPLAQLSQVYTNLRRELAIILSLSIPDI